MKSLFKASLILMTLTMSTQVYARDIIIVTYKEHRTKAELIKKLLIQDVLLPKELIEIRRQSNACEESAHSIVQICIDQDEEMRFVRFNQEVVNKSLSVFWKEGV